MNGFSVACELHRDWRRDIEGLGLRSEHIPNHRNRMTSYSAMAKTRPAVHRREGIGIISGSLQRPLSTLGSIPLRRMNSAVPLVAKNSTPSSASLRALERKAALFSIGPVESRTRSSGKRKPTDISAFKNASSKSQPKQATGDRDHKRVFAASDNVGWVKSRGEARITGGFAHTLAGGHETLRPAGPPPMPG
jgi:hypothetical protein